MTAPRTSVDTPYRQAEPGVKYNGTEAPGGDTDHGELRERQVIGDGPDIVRGVGHRPARSPVRSAITGAVIGARRGLQEPGFAVG
jgi:hypothetical protein